MIGRVKLSPYVDIRDLGEQQGKPDSPRTWQVWPGVALLREMDCKWKTGRWSRGARYPSIALTCFSGEVRPLPRVTLALMTMRTRI